MTSVLPTNQKIVEFLETEAWKHVRPVFIFGRIFGSSFMSPNKSHRIILKVHCVTSGIFICFLLCRSFWFFKDNLNKEFTPEIIFQIIFVCEFIFALISWVSALHFQQHLNECSSIIKHLLSKGYKDIQPLSRKGQAFRLCFLTMVAFANFVIMILAGFGYIPFAFYPYFYDFLNLDKRISIIFTSLSTFFSTGIIIFAVSFQLVHLTFVRKIVSQFNQKLADPNLSNPSELCSEHFVISKLIDNINRIWSVMILLKDAMFTVLLSLVGFLLVNHQDIDTPTKIVLVFWIFMFFIFFLMLNISAILLNEECEKSMSVVFKRVWMAQEAKMVEIVNLILLFQQNLKESV